MSISVYLVREYRFWGIRSRTSFLPICMAVVLPLPSMAAHLPCLPGSPPVSRRVPTSFVPPAHNQGVSLAPLQGRALWKKFLPTTGSFYVFADSGFRSPAPFGGRFLMSFPFHHSLSGAGLLLVTGTGPLIVQLSGSGRKQLLLCGLAAFLRLPPASGCLPSSLTRHTSLRSEGSGRIS